MKKFSFRLESLYRIKKQREDEEIRKLSLVVGRMNLLQDEIHSLSEEISSLGGVMAGKIKLGSSLKDYIEYDEVTRYLNLRIQSLEREYEEQNSDLELAKIRLNEASRERKVLELLKENEKKLHRKKLKRKEKQELSEIIYTLSYLDPERFSHAELSDTTLPKKEKAPEDFEKDWIDLGFEEEVRPSQEPLTEMEKLKRYYDEYIQR